MDASSTDDARKPANIHTHLASSQFSGIGAAPSSNDTDSGKVAIPKSLTEQPGLTDIWWPKFVEMYKLKGCPLTDFEQRRVLERLERIERSAGSSPRPAKAGHNLNLAVPLSGTTAVQMLKKAVTDYETSISSPPSAAGRNFADST